MTTYSYIRILLFWKNTLTKSHQPQTFEHSHFIKDISFCCCNEIYILLILVQTTDCFLFFCITATLVGSMFKYICMYVNPTSFKGLEMKPSLNTMRCLPQTNVLCLQVIHIESLLCIVASLSYHDNYYLLYFKYFRCFFMLSPKSCVEGWNFMWERNTVCASVWV